MKKPDSEKNAVARLTILESGCTKCNLHDFREVGAFLGCIARNSTRHRIIMTPMLQTVLSVSALFLSLVLLTGGSTMLGTLVGLRLELEGYSAARTGLVLSFHAVGFVLGSIYGVRIIRRAGQIRAFAVFGALACAAILIHPLYVHTDLWMMLRLVVGFCVAGLLLIVESWVNGVATAQTRGTLLGIYLVLFYLAASGGQLIIGLGDPGQFYLFSVSAILVALSLIPLSLTRSVAPQLPEATQVPIRTVSKKAPLAVMAALLSGVLLSAFNSIGPIYATRIGLDTQQLSLFMSAGVLSAMVFQFPVGRLSDYVPRNRVVLSLAATGLAAAIAASLWGEQSLWLLFASAAVYVGCAASVYPVSLALAHDLMQHEEIVGTNATLLIGFGVGTIAGPIGAATSIGLLGPSGLFVFAAFVMGVLGIVATYNWTTQKQVPVADQEQFVAVTPVSTSALMELDPRDNTYEEREEAAQEHLSQRSSDLPSQRSSDLPSQGSSDTTPKPGE